MISSSSLFLLLLGVSVSFAYVVIKDLRAEDVSASGDLRPDCYVLLSFGSTEIGQTRVVDNNKNPSWSQEFSHNAAKGDVLRLQVFDFDPFNDHDRLGDCSHTLGTEGRSCNLSRGGTLYFSYTLS